MAPGVVAEPPLPPWAARLHPPLIFLAPMDGVTDWAFRELCFRLGAEVTVSEFAPAPGLMAAPKKLMRSIGARHGDRPFLIQLYGKHPADFAGAARMIYDHLPCMGIDVNMGCPADQVVSHSHGSALMREPQLGADIVAAMCAATPLPVSVKMRAGWDSASMNAPDVAQAMQAAGACMLTIHGRTREQRFTGTASLEAIAAARQAVSIPVIGNGDIRDVPGAQRMLAETGVAGVMVARGAEGNPWLFADLRQALKGERLPDSERWSLSAVVWEHVRLAVEEHGDERQTFLPLRKHLVWYARGIPGKDGLRKRAQQVSSMADVDDWLVDVEAALAAAGMDSRPVTC
ncbi:MAG TPA: tRNA dihydrouridine synthase DusB [Chloroflexota bacterium]|jgi:nifR3 family TIM-barrel protein